MTDYLSYYQLNTPETTAELRKIKTKLEPFLDSILDDFYEFILQNEDLKKIIGSHSIKRLQGAQKAHWLTSMEHGLDESYTKRVRRIGDVHERIGLNPAYYMGGYAFILETILGTKKNVKASRFKRARKEPLLTHEDLQTFLKFVMYDMAMSIIVYQEKKTQTLTSVLGSSTDFIDQINGEIEQTASSVTEMNSTVREISEQATKAQDHATSVTEKMASVNIGMQELKDASDKIGGVLKIILEISERTNLLSLNAAIEAARAGEHGKGFAVVADEVKKLATRTNNSVEEINQQITAIQERIDLSTKDVGNVAEAIKQIEEINTSISASVHEQSSVTDQMQDFVQDVLTNAGQTKENLDNETKSLMG